MKKSVEKELKKRKQRIKEYEDAVKLNPLPPEPPHFPFLRGVDALHSVLKTLDRAERRAVLETIMRIFNEGYIEWMEDDEEVLFPRV